MNDLQDSPTASPAFRDRTTGLVVFGILEILCGCVAALMAPLVVFGRVLAKRVSEAPFMWRTTLFAVAMYIGLAAFLIWLGIGSIRRRRWARSLSLVLGWSWLVVGAISTGVVGLVVPGATGSHVVGILAVTLAVLACPMILVPGALVFFYRSPDVKATCDASQPYASWTDACPLPVLGAALWLTFGAATYLLTAASGQAVLPVVATVLVGLPAALASAPLAAVWLYAAWSLYRLRWTGWWLAVVCSVFAALGGAITYMRVDLLDVYRRMGYSEQQLAAMRLSPITSGPGLAVSLTLVCLLTLAYLLWIRKYFPAPGKEASGPGGTL